MREFNVHLVNLDPTQGSEMKKLRPCLIISPSEMNSVLGTAIIAPMTTTLRGYPSRIEIRFNGKFCEVCLDQLRAVDEGRLNKVSMGRISQPQIDLVKNGIKDMLNFNFVQ